MGPMTGRAAGYCAGYPAAGFMNPIAGRGFGWGRGFGFGRGLGWGFRGGRGWSGAGSAPYGWPAHSYGTAVPAQVAPFGAGPNPEQEVEILKRQAEYFEDALDGIRKRVAELETAAKEKA